MVDEKIFDFGGGLELGTNMFELIEFSLNRRLRDGTYRVGLYGVNVAKVREVVRMPRINPLASSVSGIAGIFELRGIPIPAVNLTVTLGDPDHVLKPQQQIIVTEFSQKRAGFVVDSTHRIRRVAWDKVLPPASDASACINGMTLVENNEFLFILDLEKILMDMERASGYVPQGDAGSDVGAEPGGGVAQAPNGTHVLIVDDSSFILTNAKRHLLKEGFEVTTATDGIMAKAILEHSLESGEVYHIVVSDIEMPRMDGLSFTKWLKSHPQLSHIPVILHSSLSGSATQDTGLSYGADGYVVKNDLQKLSSVLLKMRLKGSRGAP
jgi:two-component system chemotaxis response regulator CheV